MLLYDDTACRAYACFISVGTVMLGLLSMRATNVFMAVLPGCLTYEVVASLRYSGNIHLLRSFQMKGLAQKVLLIVAALTLFGASALFAKGTLAGTDIISTNTTITYSNSGGTVFFSTNSTNSLTNLVLAVFGMSNYSVHYSTNTNSMLAGETNFFEFVYTNNGNTNSLFNFTGGDFYTGASASPWLIEFWDAGEAAALTDNPTNIAPDTEFRFKVKIGVPGAEADGAVLTYNLTNTITDAAAATRTFSYESANLTNWFGGTNIVTNTLVIQIGGPKIIAAKTVVSITDPLGGNELIPGAVIKYRISYTNEGFDAASQVIFTEDIPDAYVAYLSSSATGAPVPDTLAFDDGSDGWTTPGDTPTTGALVNYSVGLIRFTVNTIPANGSGYIEYEVVVK